MPRPRSVRSRNAIAFRREVKGGTLREKDACEPGGRQCPLAEGADRDVRFYDRRFDRAATFRRSYATFRKHKCRCRSCRRTDIPIRPALWPSATTLSWRRGVPTTGRPMPSWTLRPKSWRRVPATIRCAIPIRDYFERMTKSPRTWGKPLGALLGAPEDAGRTGDCPRSAARTR